LCILFMLISYYHSVIHVTAVCYIVYYTVPVMILSMILSIVWRTARETTTTDSQVYTIYSNKITEKRENLR